MTTTPGLKSLGNDIGRDINLNYAFIDNLLLTSSVLKFCLKGKKVDEYGERCWSFYTFRGS